MEQLYEIIELQAYYNNSNIIPNVKIPKFQRETFILPHIIPLPINITRQIMSSKYIAYNNNSIKYYQEKCLKLENIHVCHNPTRSGPMEQSSCVGRLIRKLQPKLWEMWDDWRPSTNQKIILYYSSTYQQHW